MGLGDVRDGDEAGFGVGELADEEPVRRRDRPQQSGATQLLGSAQRGLDVGNGDIEDGCGLRGWARRRCLRGSRSRPWW
jgi:hypothetical protein